VGACEKSGGETWGSGMEVRIALRKRLEWPNAKKDFVSDMRNDV
jgi:hypothetical protein